MRIRFTFVSILTFGLFPLFAFSQEEDKLILQQQLLLSKESQADLARQQAALAQLEIQSKRLAEQEKKLLKLSVSEKESELQEAANKSRAIRLQAAYQAAVKDKQIIEQETNIRQTRRWIYYLISISLLVLLVTAIIYRNHRKTRQLNAMITAQHDELRQVSEVKDRLLAVVGHDMRSPLNMLLALSQILREKDIAKDKMKAYMAQMDSTITHTAYMMDNLLHWAASQMQGYRPIIRRVDLAQIISDILHLQNTLAAEKGVSLQNSVAPGVSALCDADMLTLVIRNLVSNSIKFTRSGGKIIISCSSKEDNAIIAVTDNGVGMSPEIIYQFNHTTLTEIGSTRGTQKEKGTGLGLLLCKTFVRLMNGNISAAANPAGNGSVFKIILPYA